MAAESAVIAASDELRLNRLTTPQWKHLLNLAAGGKGLDLYPQPREHRRSKGAALDTGAVAVPDDFERMVIVEVLPDDTTLPRLSHNDILLSLTAADGSGEVMAEDTLREGSARIAFMEPAPVGPSTLGRWRELLEHMEPDPEFVEPMLEAWQRTSWIRARYPLRINQELQYEVHSVSGESYASGRLRLTDVVMQLDLSF